MVQDSSTIRVAQVGLNISDQELEDIFSDYGPIKRCFVVKPKKTKINNKDINRTIGYVEFAIADDAKTAIDGINNKSPVLGIPGTPITVTSAPDRNSSEGGNTEEKNNRKKDKTSSVDNLAAAKQKKSRLIVRNIPWKSTESTLKAHFENETGGKVVDVNILKKKDGKMVGCAFVQLSNVSEAAKAIKLANGKPFLGRPIAVDWAVSKEQFKKSDNSFTKPNENSGDIEPSTTIKEESDEEVDNESNSTEDKDEENSDDSDGDENMEDSDGSAEDDNFKEKKDWPKAGHDINENKTVFIRNISFDSDQDDLKDMIEQNFGKVLFARLVIDKVTEHPKVSSVSKFSM